ncbi:unnamed protein product [Absidia cylindrospora]
MSDRLYSKGRVLGYERAKRNQNPNTSLIQVEGVQTTKDAQFYLGKRIAYVYRAKREVNGSKVRVIGVVLLVPMVPTVSSRPVSVTTCLPSLSVLPFVW